jgi:hypothetical protein
MMESEDRDREERKGKMDNGFGMIVTAHPLSIFPQEGRGPRSSVANNIYETK